MERVTPEPLWLGHVGDVRDVRGLFRAEIAAVVDLAVNEEPQRLPREIVYCRFPLIDGEGNSSAMLRLAVQTVAELLRHRVPTLVYCANGMSRTPAVAAGALALLRGTDADECLRELASRRPCDVSPSLWAEVRATSR